MLADLSPSAIAQPLSSNTRSLDTWDTVKRWMDECDGHHTCLTTVSKQRQWCPTRLLELVSPSTFRVVRSDTIHHQRRYVTLSHRWGQNKFLQLTLNDLPSFETGLSVNLLPKSFQETFLVAQRMGVQYVWIDSLCIIQSGDEGADWRRESSTMADVYSNGVCNISADWATEECGLFFDRDLDIFKPLKLEIRFDSEELKVWTTEMHLEVRAEDLFVSFEPDMWEDQVAKAPLNKRGWVVQERLLAPRVLHFTPREVLWECRETQSCESYPGPLPEKLRLQMQERGPMMRNLELRGTAGESPSAQASWERMMGVWRHAWGVYALCDLTRGSDKLVAIAGVARKIKAAVHDQYIAGVWLNDLPWGLLWYCSAPERLPKPTEYRAPTFSWASTDSAPSPFGEHDRISSISSMTIDCVKYRHQSAAQLRDSTYTDEVFEADIFGPIYEPVVELRVKATLKSCTLRIATTLKVEEGASCYIIPTDSPTPIPDSHAYANLDNAIDDSQKLEHSEFYYIIWDGRQAGAEHLLCILLEATDRTLGRFERIGMLHFDSNWDGFESQKQVLMRPQGNGRDLPCWTYEETTGNHTIYLV